MHDAYSSKRKNVASLSVILLLLMQNLYVSNTMVTTTSDVNTGRKLISELQ